MKIASEEEEEEEKELSRPGQVFVYALEV